MGAWSPAAVHRPALAWGADARRASVRPFRGVLALPGLLGPAAYRRTVGVDHRRAAQEPCRRSRGPSATVAAARDAVCGGFVYEVAMGVSLREMLDAKAGASGRRSTLRGPRSTTLPGRP